MNAELFVYELGKSAIGKTIMTERMGDYPGGPATVTEIYPDPEAPEIVMYVNNPAWTSEDGSHVMGIFVHEEVSLDRAGILTADFADGADGIRNGGNG